MAKANNQNASKDSEKPLDSTTKIPMIDLGTAIEVVTMIREKAVETAAMPTVATSLGYANATSTPFYRRITSARLFNLLSAKSTLTQQAIDYLRPHDEQMKARVLVDAVMAIPYDAQLVERYAAKKLNVELVANAIAKDCNLTDACATICARAFEGSLKFAGMLLPDGTVNAAQKSQESSLPPPPTPQLETSGGKPLVRDEPGTHEHQHSLYLDKDKSRKFSFTGPLEISRSEYGRICKWLEFTMIITGPEEPT